MREVKQSQQNAAAIRATGIMHSSALARFAGNENLCCYNSAGHSATTEMLCCC